MTVTHLHRILRDVQTAVKATSCYLLTVDCNLDGLREQTGDLACQVTTEDNLLSNQIT